MKRKFSSFKGYLTEWPFPKGEATTLYWLRSPYIGGERKQWMMTAIFKRPSGEIKEVTVPWGALPILRLGETFIDGAPMGLAQIGKEYQFNFSNVKIVGLKEAGESISRNSYRLVTSSNLAELCVVISSNKQTIIVPCLEIIRFFFTVNKLMAFRILEPFNFGDIVAATLEDKTIKMNFQSRLALLNLNDLFVQILAKILSAPSWYESWRSVYISREKQIVNKNTDPKSSIPLSCLPPVLENSSWYVRGIEDEGKIIVLEILRYHDNNLNRFNEIELYHPRAKTYKRNYYTRKGPSVINKAKIKISRKVTTPTNFKDPLLINYPMPIHEDIEPIVIKEMTKEISLIGVGKKGIGIINGPPNLKGPDGGTIVSLNDESGKGDTQAADFLPTSEQIDSPKGLINFFKAINFMKSLNSSLNISHLIDIVPSESPLAYCGFTRRSYAWVKILNNNREISIVEFDLSDGHGISTLILNSINPELIRDLPRDYIVGYGYWNKKKLKPKANTRMAKHTSLESENWGQRILEKVEELTKNNAAW